MNQNKISSKHKKMENNLKTNRMAQKKKKSIFKKEIKNKIKKINNPTGYF